MYCMNCGNMLETLCLNYYRTDQTLLGCPTCKKLFTTNIAGSILKKHTGNYDAKIIELRERGENTEKFGFIVSKTG